MSPYLIPHGIMWDCLNANLDATSIYRRYDDRHLFPKNPGTAYPNRKGLHPKSSKTRL